MRVNRRPPQTQGKTYRQVATLARRLDRDTTKPGSRPISPAGQDSGQLSNFIGLSDDETDETIRPISSLGPLIARRPPIPAAAGSAVQLASPPTLAGGSPMRRQTGSRSAPYPATIAQLRRDRQSAKQAAAFLAVNNIFHEDERDEGKARQ